MLVEQDAELGQMRQAVDQLRQEKAKEAEPVDKLAEENEKTQRGQEPLGEEYPEGPT